MGLKQYKANSAGIRGRIVVTDGSLAPNAPLKALVRKRSSSAGRNNLGRVTVRHRGGGVKRKFRVVDFKRNKAGGFGIVKQVEYDPNRSANIALIHYLDGDKRYILAPDGLKPGQKIGEGAQAEIKTGNSLMLKDIPTGSQIHSVEFSVKNGGKIARSAGTSCVLMAKGDEYASVKLPSGEIRLISLECRATLGSVGNGEHRNRNLGKAGAKRWKGFRPTVRGSVMNACDHPHGGGEGKAPIGRPGPVTPWGKPTLGYKTRNKRKSNRLIVRRRK